MLKIPCIILFIISYTLSADVIHYAQNYSHEHCQNSPLTFEMIRCCNYSIGVM